MVTDGGAAESVNPFAFAPLCPQACPARRYTAFVPGEPPKKSGCCLPNVIWTRWTLERESNEKSSSSDSLFVLSKLKKKQNPMDKETEKGIDFLIKEYEILWQYYYKSLEERKNIFEYYFKAVAISAAVMSVLALITRAKVDLLSIEKESIFLVAGSIFVVIFFMGFSCLVYYLLEARNGKRYQEVLSSIREKMYAIDPVLSKSLIMIHNHPQTNAKENRWGLDWIIWWRAQIFISINSGVGCAAAVLLLSALSPSKPIGYWAGIMFVILIALHWFVLHSTANRPME